MKKSITYSVALVSTTLLGNTWAVEVGIQPSPHAITDGQNIKDSFLSILLNKKLFALFCCFRLK